MTEKKNKLLALLVLCVLLLSSCLLDDTENDDLSSYSGGPSYTDGVSSTDEPPMAGQTRFSHRHRRRYFRLSKKIHG